ncbi:D-lactate dehydrogenase [Chitinasiproducens palmae]|uniref:Quinone-dependent D-lactate dehydrogenase n=1 Tax=Chitinasiproducens palmae TaxID=1770053 RepID=A0A1H2PW29_9BURK|nr:D-lactate dehydrogenase [Chitinasiproducens palmae]SDV51517.1 D-lactate dehydrogenase [Chitinasiproducens palmae]
MSSSSASSRTLPAEQRRRQLITDLQAIVGNSWVLTADEATRRYRTGFRFGSGKTVAVIRPGSLVEQWRVLQACVAANVIVIMQAANTGLTGGSTPDGDDYDRDVVIINTLRMKKLHVIDEGRQVICFPGATLDQLEQTLKPLGREPHSVIGSSCIGASVFGGVCNNSGGSLVQRGPAYTEMALFAQLDEHHQLHLVNHLGVRLSGTPEEVLDRLERHVYTDDDIEHGAGAASDREYAQHVRDVDADTPARFNADPRRLYETSGCAGKLMLFAVRLDTFPMEKGAKVFYIGTNDAGDLTEIRRHVLAHFQHVPIAGEYLHRDAFDIADVYGKDTFLLIDRLGTARLPSIFSAKSRVDAFCDRLGFLPANLSDRVMQALSRLFPDHLPPRIREFRARYEHHLLLKVSAASADETRAFLAEQAGRGGAAYFECSDDEGRKAFLLRFAAAGAAVRYRNVHAREVEDIVALDIALRRNDRDWLETLPPEMDRDISIKMYYGHFFCHVFHQDYIARKGVDCLALEHAMWRLLDERGAEYPAEHNVGHLYEAKPALRDFYRKLDPCNCFNPGIGKTPRFSHWVDQAAAEQAATAAE